MQWIAVALAVTLLASQARAAESPTHTIYRCETAQGITFADRPCGPNSQPYAPDLRGVSVIATTPPATVSITRDPPAARATRQGSSSAATTKADVCLRLAQSLHKIASTMRAGYSAKQGERLRERKQELEDKRRQQRC
ncbi:MAG TPA: hypothetical protein VKB34_16015 [Povalibacter sp.]|nr:hypothetical protein [Povalibacter sp.]